MASCIILAGGRGSRLQSILKGVPKCLAPVGKMCFLDYQIELLLDAGVTRFIMSLCNYSDQIISYVKRSKYSRFVEFCVDDIELGTGGAILNAMMHFSLRETFVINGDTYLNGPLKEFIERPLADASGIILVALVDNSNRYGSIKIENQRVVSFNEKSDFEACGYINAGLYHLGSNIFRGYRRGAYFSLERDVFQALAPMRQLKTSIFHGNFIDIGIPEDYHKFILLSKKLKV